MTRDAPPIADLPIAHTFDTIVARRTAAEAARALGFDAIAVAEIAIVTSELCSNVVKYGVRGRLRIERADAERGVGIRIVAFDEGPPFRDFDAAIEDGCDDTGPIDPLRFSGRGGIGAGLGAVVRFSDDRGWRRLDRGKEVWAVRYAARSRRR